MSFSRSTAAARAIISSGRKQSPSGSGPPTRLRARPGCGELFSALHQPILIYGANLTPRLPPHYEILNGLSHNGVGKVKPSQPAHFSQSALQRVSFVREWLASVVSCSGLGPASFAT